MTFASGSDSLPAMWARIAAAVAASALVVAVGVAGYRVQALERSELEYQSPEHTLRELAKKPGATRVSARLGEVALEASEHAVFEVCSSDRLEPERWLGTLDFAVFQLEPMRLLLRVPLDQAHLDTVRRNDRGACLTLGRGPIESAGRYSIDAVWPERAPPEALTDVQLRARVLGRTPLGPLERGLLWVLAAAIAVALGLAFAVSRAPESEVAGATPRPSLLAAVGALFALVAASQLPLFGSTLTLVKGVVLVALQAGLAFALAAHAASLGHARLGLALIRPQHTLVWVAAALGAGLALPKLAQLALAVVPSTGEAPIETFISWPSGMLAFGTLGMLLPVAEELFFRGMLYGAALRLGRAAAFTITLAVFVAMHAQQSWGNWGGLLAIAVTGTVLTTLRALSGSTLIPALAHVLYNFTLSLGSF